MTRTLFTDFEEFADAIDGLAGRFMPTARPETDWFVDFVPIGRVPIQQIHIGGASTFAGDGEPGTVALGLPLTPSRQIRIDGQHLESNSLILIKEDQLFTFAARQRVLWAGITLPTDHALLTPELLSSLSKKVSRGKAATHVRSALPAVTAAKHLVSRVCTSDGSVGFAGAATARAAEEEVITIATHVIETCNTVGEVHVGRRRIPRDRIIARVLAMFEAYEGQPLLIQDFCRATRVSERTLRNIFQEYFGVGPMRLVKVRQLHEIRMALTAADPGAPNVSSIAAHFGVWDLDAFARNYAALYGETPSATLRRPPRARNTGRNLSATWIRYASRRFRDP